MAELEPETATASIPRTIHRVWLGSDPLPQDYVRYGESWRAHHPGWTMRLWTDSDLEELDCEEALARGRGPAERSDLVRYEVLRRYGGVYVDTDFEAFQPIDPLLEGVDAFTAYLRVDRAKIATGIMGCVPGHPAFEIAAARAAEWIGTVALGETGPWLMFEVVRDFPEVTVFGAELFYPYHWTELHLRDSEFPEAYAAHHWSLRFLGKLHERRLEGRERVEELKRELARAEMETNEEKRRRKAAEARVKDLENRGWRRVAAAARRAAGRRP